MALEIFAGGIYKLVVRIDCNFAGEHRDMHRINANATIRNGPVNRIADNPEGRGSFA
jgi:hypothetical protein